MCTVSSIVLLLTLMGHNMVFIAAQCQVDAVVAKAEGGADLKIL